MATLSNPLTHILLSASAGETEVLGARLGLLLGPGDIICLEGPLGAGKTTMARGIARGWGSADRVTSPTFTLVNEYRRVVVAGQNERLLHVDCYRLSDEEDAESAGLGDLVYGEDPLVIEWPECIAAWLPIDRLTIRLEPEGGQRGMRRLILTAGGERSALLLAGIEE